MKVVTVLPLLSLFVTIVTSLTTQELANSNNIFTAAVYKEATKNANKNLLVSPLSAGIAFALTQSGARDKTAEEIRSVLRLPQDKEEVKSGFKTLLKTLKSDNETTLHTANKIYIGESFEIKEEFKRSAIEAYQAEIENVDFSKNVETAKAINEWVEQKTENKIRNLVDPSSISSGTAAMIINTIYFKASWIDRDFYKGPFIKKDFFKTASEIIKVDSMSKHGVRLNYYNDPELKTEFLELPLLGEDASMVIALPNEKEGLLDLEAKAEKVFGSHNFKKEIVSLTMPLFKIESKIDFKDVLQKLGVRKAFNLGEADFSGIAGNKGDLAIDGALQKTFINVNRSGVEAAAATNIWFFLSGPPPSKVIFRVDHPFIFYIQVKGVILFAGKVTHPEV